MAANLGLDTLITELANLAGSATGSWSKLQTILNRFKSSSSNNLFGTAALKNVGTTSGTIPQLGTGGRLASARLPVASATIKGAVELATNAEAITGTDTSRAVTLAALEAALNDVTGGYKISTSATGSNTSTIYFRT